MKADSANTGSSDAELLSAVSRGDEPALTGLYDRFAPILLGLIFRIVRSQREAEDVLQEVFVQVWQRAGDYDPARGRPFLWLSSIARSRAVDRLRSLRARERLAVEIGAEPEPIGTDVADDAADAEERAIVRQALSEISQAQREALVFAYFDGLTQAEIAVRTGEPLGTVKTRTRLGLVRLRARLAELRGRGHPGGGK